LLYYQPVFALLSTRFCFIINEMSKKQSGNEDSIAELGLLRQIRRRAGAMPLASALSLGIGDDCALLDPGRGKEIAVTTDLSIDGRHFRLDWHPPEVIGHRALARGLSDLAAMGARPLAAFISLGVPKQLTVTDKSSPTWVSRFYDGLVTLAEQYDTPLAGGDLAESPVALADIVLVGAVRRGDALLRSGARAGDGLYVTGWLGGSAAGLEKLARLDRTSQRRPGRILTTGRPANGVLQRHFYPQPRIEQGDWLVRHGMATAAIDLSDGLSTDLAHLCEESGVTAEVEADAIPVALSANLEQALHGGEDYELLFTAPKHQQVPHVMAGVPVTRIGRIGGVKNRPQITLLAPDGSAKPLEPRGWQHFTQRRPFDGGATAGPE
jgi:thiamine-monophosphate kinase